MIRIEFAESSQSRRTEAASKQNPAKRPALLKRLFGARKPQKAHPATQRGKQARGSSPAEQEMLIV